MTPSNRRHRERLGRFAALVLAAALAVSACGGSGGSGDAGGEALDVAALGEPGRSDLPAVEVVEVGTGASIQLTDLPSFAGDRPILLWFWAPH
ncbi:MAG: hypothetical protein KDB21_06115 [Acidimicrobiales bacterium]|nr:hypothetical protein [Acidimicrobiales bacterium]